MAQKAKQVYGVEIIKEAIDDAKRNAALNHMDNVEFFSGKEKSAEDYEQELFYHIVVDGAEQVVKPAQAAVVTRILEAVYRSAESGETIYFD